MTRFYVHEQTPGTGQYGICIVLDRSYGHKIVYTSSRGASARREAERVAVELEARYS